MQKALIKLIYRHIINSNASSGIEKLVFDASYSEFLLKSQAYNKDLRFQRFLQMKDADGRANSLHYKTSFAVIHIIEDFHNKIPFLQNTLGGNIAFDNFHFELVESSISDKSVHQLAINFITGDLTLIEVMGDYLLLSEGDKRILTTGNAIETFMLKMQAGLSIMSYAGIPASSFAAN
ncbi:MAG TPA: hypothetical protein PKM63_05390 [Panacibacter sp.]|nr:hypothetical protein [Panacibacter sp.]HNP43696.1 hypothetical protein [Panacibacter sp.]